jgi:S-formylglutathione hydrolase FrmB
VWIHEGNLQHGADEAFQQGKADPTIIVTPYAERTFYLNHVRGEFQFEDFFFDEFMPHIERTYRCLREKRFRSIAGLSMGGFGCLLYALHRPEMFQSCYAMSAAVRTDDEIKRMPLPEFHRRYETALGQIGEGEERITDFWNQNSVLFLVKNLPDGQKKLVRYFIDCGDDDPLYTGNSLLHVAMRDAGIPHEYRVRDGGHTWEYWKISLPAALAFITQGLR